VPIFDFKCDNCDTVVEKLVKSAETELKCNKCGASMSRQVGLSNFQLKGSGWFKDGYSTKPNKG